MRYKYIRNIAVVLYSIFCIADFVWAACPSNMTAYWKLDEEAETYAESVNGNNGECGAACPENTIYGRVNGAQKFNGKDTQINVPASDKFNWGKDESFSIEYWMKMPEKSLTSGQAVIGRSDGLLFWWAGVSDMGNAAFVLRDSGGTAYTIKDDDETTKVALNDGQWHHVAAVRNNALGRLVLYVDGKEKKSLSRDYSADFASSTAPLTMGWVNSGSGNYFEGFLDEAALYNRALSLPEVKNHYANGLADIRWNYCEEPSQIRIMPLGDSITAGETKDLNKTEQYPQMVGYRQKLYNSLKNLGYDVDFVGSQAQGSAASPAFDYDSEGHPGWTPTQISDNISSWLTANPADIVLLHIGTNGLSTGTIDSAAAKVEDILKEIDLYSRDITVILAKIVNHKVPVSYVTDFNKLLEEKVHLRQIAGDKIILVDQENALTYPVDMSNDLHPAESGYEKMADVWLQGLLNSLEEPANMAPVAEVNVESDIVTEGQTVTLDGSESKDLDGGIASYLWEQVSGKPDVIIERANTSIARFTAPELETLFGLTFRLTVTDGGGLTGQDEITIRINAAPDLFADPGSEQTVNNGDTVNLDASNSIGDIVSYQWERESGPNVTLSNPASAQTTFIAPSVGESGDTLVLKLTVTDTIGRQNSKLLNINIQYKPLPPVADTGDDQTVIPGTIVFLNASESYDLDGRLMAYKWEQTEGESVTLFGANSIKATFTAPSVTDIKTFGFKLTVEDDDGLTSEDTILITVKKTSAPVAVPGESQSVKNKEIVTLDGSKSYATEGSLVAYKWEQISEDSNVVTISNAETAKASFTAPVVQKDESMSLKFKLTVTDSNNVKAEGEVSILVAYANLPPAANAGADQSADEKDSVMLDGSGSSDPHNDTLSYEWTQISGTSASLSNANTSKPRFTAPSLSSSSSEKIVFRLTVKDSMGESSSDEVQITILPKKPVADAGDDQTVKNKVRVTLDGLGSTSFGGTLTSYQWVQTFGPSVALATPRSAMTTFTAPDDIGPEGASLVFELTVEDSRGLTDTSQVIVNVTYSNIPPVAEAGADQSVSEGKLVVLDGTGSNDTDDGIASYQWTQLSGTPVSLSNADSSIAGFTAPEVSSTTEFIFKLVVEDERGLKDSDEIHISVNVSLGPEADAGSDQEAASGNIVALNGLNSSAGFGDIVSYEWVQISGPSIALSSPSSAISTFIAPVVGLDGNILKFRLTVTDSKGRKDSAEVSVSITFSNIQPKADAGQDRVLLEGVKVFLDGSGSYDPDGGIMTYKWKQLSGTAVELSGADTPRASFIAPEVSVAGLIFQLTVEDKGGLSDSDDVLLTVNVATGPKADPGENQTAANGEIVTLDGSNSFASIGQIVSYKWEQIFENSSPSVTLSSANASVTQFAAPSVGTEDIFLIFKLTVTDSNKIEDSAQITVKVSFTNIPPVADAGDSQIVSEGTTVTLNGSNSYDPDGGIASYEWVQKNGKTVTLSQPNSVTTTFVAPSVGENGLLFELTVSDKNQLKKSDQVLITINDNGITQFSENIISFSSNTGRSLGMATDENSYLTALSPVSDSTISSTVNRPENFIYGLVNMEIKTSQTGSLVTVYLPEPAPTGYDWYEYSIEDGWQSFGSRAIFNETRDQITLTFTDGGAGDSLEAARIDGFVKNISGLAIKPTSAKSDKNELISCFIDLSGENITSFNIKSLICYWVISLILLFNIRQRK